MVEASVEFREKSHTVGNSKHDTPPSVSNRFVAPCVLLHFLSWEIGISRPFKYYPTIFKIKYYIFARSTVRYVETQL
jgi:hypothetical protein